MKLKELQISKNHNFSFDRGTVFVCENIKVLNSTKFFRQLAFHFFPTYTQPPYTFYTPNIVTDSAVFSPYVWSETSQPILQFALK